MNLPSLAWRNVWRHPGRTLLTASAVAFSSALLTFAGSLQLSSYDAMIRSTTAMYDSELQVQREGYRQQPAIWKTIPDPRAVESALSHDKRIEQFSSRAMGFALLSSGQRSRGAQVTGVIPSKEGRLISIPGLVRKGSWLNDTDRNSIVIGKALAENLKVSLGEELTLLGQGNQGTLAVGVLTVTGIYQSGSEDIDRSLAFVPLATFQEIFSLGDSVHTFVAKLTKIDDAIQVDQTIGSLFPNGSTVSLRWDELNPGLKQAIELDLISGWIFFGSLALIVSLGVFNTFLMSTLERNHEFGVMLAVGLSRAKLLLMIVLEAIGFVVVGLIPGIALGTSITLYFGYVGFAIPGTEEILKIWNLPGAIFPWPHVSVLTSVSLLFCSLSLLLAIPVFLKLHRIRMIEALK